MEPAELLRRIVVKLRRETVYFETTWVQPWEALRAGGSVSTLVTCEHAAALTFAQRLEQLSADDPPAYQQLFLLDHPSSTELLCRRYQCTFDRQEVALQSVDATRQLAAHAGACRSLMTLCEGQCVPAIEGGVGSDEEIAEVHSYHRARTPLRQALFTVEQVILPFLSKAQDLCSGSPTKVSTAVTLERARLAMSTFVKGSSQPAPPEAAHLSDIEFEELTLAHEEGEPQRSVEEMRRLADDMKEIRELQGLVNTQTHQQQEVLASAAASAEASLEKSRQAKYQLGVAAKLQVAGATVTGALIGGLIGGPVGMLAGAQSAAAIGMAALAGGATGGVISKAVVSATAARVTRSLKEDESEK